MPSLCWSDRVKTNYALLTAKSAMQPDIAALTVSWFVLIVAGTIAVLSDFEAFLDAQHLGLLEVTRASCAFGVYEVALYLALRLFPLSDKIATPVVSILPKFIAVSLVTITGRINLAVSILLGHHVVFLLREIFISELPLAMILHHVASVTCFIIYVGREKQEIALFAYGWIMTESAIVYNLLAVLLREHAFPPHIVELLPSHNLVMTLNLVLWVLFRIAAPLAMLASMIDGFIIYFSVHSDEMTARLVIILAVLALICLQIFWFVGLVLICLHRTTRRISKTTPTASQGETGGNVTSQQ